MFKTARLELEDTAAKVHDKTAHRQAAMKERMEKFAEKRKEQLDKSEGQRDRQDRVHNVYALARLVLAHVAVRGDVLGMVYS